MVQYLKQYTVELLLGCFAIAALVLSAELPGMWPGSIPKKASWFLNGSPQCFDELLDRADVDIADNVQDHPNYLIPPEYLNEANLIGTALEFDYGEQMPKCALSCTRGNHINTVFTLNVHDTNGNDEAFTGLLCDSTNGQTTRTVTKTVTTTHATALCGNGNGVVAANTAAPAGLITALGAAAGAFGDAPTIQCTNDAGIALANDQTVILTLTPGGAGIAYYGEDCLADGATSLKFLWNGVTYDECISPMKVNGSWPYGPLDGPVADDSCVGRIAEMPSHDTTDSRYDAIKGLERPLGHAARTTAGRQRYPATTTAGAATTAPPKATTLSRETIQIVANVMPDKDLLSWTFENVKAQEMNKCPEIIENFRKNTTGFDIYDADDVAEFLACNAIYGFSIAEECVSVLDPRYAHLIDTSSVTDFDAQIKEADRLAGIAQCSYKSKAACAANYAGSQPGIAAKTVGQYSDASRAPLTATGNAATIATELKAKSCVVNEFRGRLNYDGGKLFNVDLDVQPATDSQADAVIGQLSSGKPLVKCEFFTANGIGADPKHVCQAGTKEHVIPGGDPTASALFYTYTADDAPTDIPAGDKIDGPGPHGVTDYGFSTFGLGALHNAEWQLAYERFVESAIYLAAASEKIDREDEFWDVFPESCFESGATNSGMNNTFIVLYRFFSITLLILIFPRFLIFNCLPAVEDVGGGSLLLIDNEGLMKKITKRSLWSRLILVFGLFTGVIGVVCAQTLDPAPETALLNQQASWSAFFNNLRSEDFDSGATAGISELLFDLSNDNHAGLVLYSDVDRTNAYYWSIMSGVVVFLSFFKIASRDVDEDGEALTGGKLGGGWA